MPSIVRSPAIFCLLSGWRYIPLLTAWDALEKLELRDFDAVLMDMHMPRMNGLTAVREIRRQERWSKLPVVALTAQARIEDQNASLQAGMTAHLTKPIDERVLYRTLIDVLDLASHRHAGRVETGGRAADRVADSVQAADLVQVADPMQGDFTWPWPCGV